MQPEYRIAWAHTLLEPAASIEAADFTRPSVTALDAGDERLADAELRSDVLLEHALPDQAQDFAVPSIQLLHPFPLDGNYSQRAISLLGLDLDVWAGEQQKPLNVRRAGDGVAKQALVAARGSAPVLLYTPIPEPLAYTVQRRLVGIGEAETNAALILVDLDAALSIEKGGKVARKCIGRVIGDFHLGILAYSRRASSMAVPVMRWILSRVLLCDEVLRELEAAA